MGATSFIHKVTARTAKEAFDLLIAEANESHGTESYNGSINTCTMGRCKKTYDKFNKATAKEAFKFIDDQGNGEKWTAHYIDMGVTSCVVTTIKKKAVDGGKPEFKMQHCVYEHDMFNGDSYTGEHFNTKTDADKKAMELALKNDKTYRVSKEYVNVKKNTSSLVTETVSERKAYKTKPVLKDMPNRKVEEFHTYYFYGWASC
jgi:hypothetical protein